MGRSVTGCVLAAEQTKMHINSSRTQSGILFGPLVPNQKSVQWRSSPGPKPARPASSTIGASQLYRMEHGSFPRAWRFLSVEKSFLRYSKSPYLAQCRSNIWMHFGASAEYDRDAHLFRPAPVPWLRDHNAGRVLHVKERDLCQDLGTHLLSESQHVLAPHSLCTGVRTFMLWMATQKERARHGVEQDRANRSACCLLKCIQIWNNSNTPCIRVFIRE